MELIKAGPQGLSFGDSTLASKTKQDGFDYQGSVYKVKTYRDITKLERNESFVYESVPGTEVSDFVQDEAGVSFSVRGPEDAQITVGLDDDTAYDVFVNGKEAGRMTTGLGGKLSVSVSLGDGVTSVIEIKRA